jgi:hypothetical protein
VVDRSNAERSGELGVAVPNAARGNDFPRHFLDAGSRISRMGNVPGNGKA